MVKCAEAGPNTLSCDGGHVDCKWCNRTFCNYHGPPNDGGRVGGHSHCKGPKCSVRWGVCGGKMVRCGHCEHMYCKSHVQRATGFCGSASPDGHLCDIGCQVTVVHHGNCKGCKSQAKECVAGCGYKFCPYHFMPVPTLWTLQGGHVCKEVTMGTSVLGDSAGDYLMLIAKASIAVVTGGESVFGECVFAAVAEGGALAGSVVVENVVEKYIQECIGHGMNAKDAKELKTHLESAKKDPKNLKSHVSKAAALVKASQAFKSSSGHISAKSSSGHTSAKNPTSAKK